MDGMVKVGVRTVMAQGARERAGPGSVCPGYDLGGVVAVSACEAWRGGAEVAN